MILWVILIVIALVLGAYIGYQWRRNTEPHSPIKFHRDYLQGLNYLLNNQNAKATDVLISLLKVDKNTVETHISLGSLFRKRGDIERALELHHRLLKDAELSKEQHAQVVTELGHDYLSAGVFDRAEKYFVQSMQYDDHRQPVLNALKDIYEKEHNWQKALLIAQKVELATGKSLKKTMAHYHCCLAEQLKGDESLQQLKLALRLDKNCVRANLQLGQQLIAVKDYKAALQALQKIKQQDARYLTEALKSIALCYEQLEDEPGLWAFLQAEVAHNPQLPFVILMSQRIAKMQSEQAAETFLIEQVGRHPSFSGLKMLIDSHVDQVDGKAQEDLKIFKNLIDKVLAKKPQYRCSQCGFAGRVLHWQCIKCKSWGAVLPVQGEEY